ncbi:AAA family ATPase [Polyangium jinanense]|uniref:ATP-binding protein n=1 Tax=Polyangium jinanense TaxID=2829994 RepID=A0A9X4APF6_9BACT|nr:ATP-binding protein [Polyangium jinanense]MDC3952329.1 ATP-binding protein [Polyangium jinanense]MDC3979958.1 ATP-binding protein [Polyangium jinanense]
MSANRKAPREYLWRFGAVELGASIALGGDVRLELDPRTTVLVGKNGAGKSAIFDKFLAGSWGASGVVQDAVPDPGRFAVEINHKRVPNSAVRYECRWKTMDDEGGVENPLDAEKADRYAEIEETCSFVEPSLGEKVLWTLQDGRLVRNDGTTDVLPRGRGLLNWWIASKSSFSFNAMVEPLFELLFRVWSVRAGVPRANRDREVAIVPHPWPFGRTRLQRRYEHISPGVRQLVDTLATWYESERGRLDELGEVGRRLGLLNDIKVRLFDNPEHAADVRAPRNLASVSVDNVDVGLLSDGTQRVLQILMALIQPDRTLLLLEEPEIAVHPGLLGRLLEEIEAYSADKQIVISTQSPQVVSWAKPDALRLVERRSGTTYVRGLDAEEQAQVERYLEDEGTLGDYLYSGAIDG